MTTPSGDEILHAAIAVSPNDVSAVSSWLINQQPPPLRGRLVASVRETIRRDYLSGGATGRCRSPQLFEFDQAERIWNDLSAVLSGTEGSKRFLEDATEYFKPEESTFAPIAYPDAWPPAEWNYPLSPAELRTRLRIRPVDVDKIRQIVLRCAETNQKKRADGAGKLLAFTPLGPRPIAADGKVRVGVLPYADTLALPALLFAVSDLVACLDFEPASLYRSSTHDDGAPHILGGNFDIGYSTEGELSADRTFEDAFFKKIVFDAPFERSILLRAWGDPSPRHLVSYVSLSFVGHFAANNACKLDRTEQGFPLSVMLQEPQRFPLTGLLDPIVDWEPELVLAFLSTVGTDERNTSGPVGRAVFLSTDAHMWCNYSGLIACGETHSDANASNPMRGVRSFGPKVRVSRASWRPTDAQRSSTLCWFMPKGNTQANDVEFLNNLVNEYFVSPTDRMLYSPPETSEGDQRGRAAEIAQCLLAPLLKCYPWYHGPMMSAPPEQWLVKLLGPSAYLDHVPLWRKRLADVLTHQTRDVPGEVSSLVQKLSTRAA